MNDTHAEDADIKPVNDKKPMVKEIEVLETINFELEQRVAKLLAENEKLHKENEYLKQTYNDLYDSIKKKRVQTKDLNDSLIAQVKSKTVENADFKAQIQEKVFANVALKNELRKLKGNSVDTKQIVTGHRFSPSKSFAVNEKEKTPRSCLGWIPTGRIFNTSCLRDDWDRLSQPMFDEYFNPPTIAVSLVQEVVASRAKVLADSPMSISIIQDAPSTSIPSSQEQQHSLIISQDEFGGVLKNKARIVAQVFRQEEGIDFKESFAPDNPSHVYKLKKALCGLKQAPRALYDMLSSFLSSQHFSKGAVDPTLFIRQAGNDLLLAKPTEKHLQAVKRIFRYIKGTIIWDYGIQRTPICHSQLMQMPIMRGVKTLDVVHREALSF
nr:hypothetical protein [Tanacetum cinerariifolium]